MKNFEYIHYQGTNRQLKPLLETINDFPNKIGLSVNNAKSQKEKNKIVKKYQNDLKKWLEQKVEGYTWAVEHSVEIGRRESIDIYGSKVNMHVIIELDAHRADQISKKFVSRMALYPSHDQKVIYIAICYPGTKSMNSKECRKYFEYCASIATRMGHSYGGIILKK